MSLRSALYVGTVSHHRLVPKRHELRHRVYWLLLDLAELAQVDARLKMFSHNRVNLTSLHNRDHGAGTSASLLAQARGHLHDAGIDNADISIQLLCMPRVVGYDFKATIIFKRKGHHI